MALYPTASGLKPYSLLAYTLRKVGRVIVNNYGHFIRVSSVVLQRANVYCFILKRSTLGPDVVRAERDLVGPPVRQRRGRLRQDQRHLYRLPHEDQQNRH
jgi:hypothetical protein